MNTKIHPREILAQIEVDNLRRPCGKKTLVEFYRISVENYLSPGDILEVKDGGKLAQIQIKEITSCSKFDHDRQKTFQHVCFKAKIVGDVNF